MGFKESSIAVVLIGLFAISMLFFSVGLSLENDAPPLTDHESFSALNSSLSENLEAFKTSSNSNLESLQSQDAQSGGDEGFGLTAIVSAVFDFISIQFAIFNVITGFIEQSLGIPSIVVNVVFGILILTMVIYAWRVWKAGGT